MMKYALREDLDRAKREQRESKERAKRKLLKERATKRELRRES